MKNTGRTYESLVEFVFKQLMEQDNIRNISIEKNKTIQGKSTSHEIDVYWEFIIGGIKYATIIQAKDWASKVPQGEMLKFKAILEDLPGQPRGIFITKTGYQSGALNVAKANGIIAYEFRKPIDEDWEGRVKKVVINMKACFPNIETDVIFDTEWIQQELAKLSLDKIELSINGMQDELFIKNEDGTKWKSLFDIGREEQAKFGMTVMQNKEVIVEMDASRYLDTEIPEFPRAKVAAVKLIISISLHCETIELDGTQMVSYILRNLLDNTEIVFDQDAKIRKQDKVRQ